MIWPQQMMEHYSLDWVRGTRGNEILDDSHAIFIRFFLDTQQHLLQFGLAAATQKQFGLLFQLMNIGLKRVSSYPSVVEDVPVTFSPHKSKPCLVTRILAQKFMVTLWVAYGGGSLFEKCTIFQAGGNVRLSAQIQLLNFNVLAYKASV